MILLCGSFEPAEGRSHLPRIWKLISQWSSNERKIAWYFFGVSLSNINVRQSKIHTLRSGEWMENGHLDRLLLEWISVSLVWIWVFFWSTNHVELKFYVISSTNTYLTVGWLVISTMIWDNQRTRFIPDQKTLSDSVQFQPAGFFGNSDL